MEKILSMIKSERVYKRTWSIMLISLIIATFMSGFLSLGLIPLEMTGAYLLIDFLFVLIAAFSAVFYYTIRVLKAPKKEKTVVYYKRGKR